jgi:hypothetical protein
MPYKITRNYSDVEPEASLGDSIVAFEWVTNTDFDKLIRDGYERPLILRPENELPEVEDDTDDGDEADTEDDDADSGRVTRRYGARRYRFEDFDSKVIHIDTLDPALQAQLNLAHKVHQHTAQWLRSWFIDLNDLDKVLEFLNVVRVRNHLENVRWIISMDDYNVRTPIERMIFMGKWVTTELLVRDASEVESTGALTIDWTVKL